MTEETKDKQKGDEAPKLDPKWLRGLKYRDNEMKKEKGKDGREVKKYMPRERDLKPDDVLSFKVHDDHVVIVTADGQKYKVGK